MPFQSEKQRRFMWSQHPEIAQRWADEGKGYVVGKGMDDKGGTTANNSPVGTAGQPQPKGNGKGLKKHEANDEARFAAIRRRIDSLNGKGGKGK